MLGIASFYDIWKREIHDVLWIGFGGLSVVLLLFDPNFAESILAILISLIIAPFAIFLWRTGMFGGADAFALIVLASLAPMITLTNNPITPLTTISNGALLFVFPLLINVIRNLVSILKNENIFEGFNETRFKKSLAMIIGYRAKNPNYGFSIERTESGQKKLNIAFHNAETTEFCSSKNTWITPGIPYLLLITGGFIIQLFYGDLLMSFFGIRI
jgi:preflagellin peptidase FlaK